MRSQAKSKGTHFVDEEGLFEGMGCTYCVIEGCCLRICVEDVHVTVLR
jgi:hypothetical protein